MVFWLSEEACCAGDFLAGRGGAWLGGIQLPPPAILFVVLISDSDGDDGDGNVDGDVGDFGD